MFLSHVFNFMIFFVQINTRVCVCAHIYMYAGICVCTHVYIHWGMCVCAQVYGYITFPFKLNAVLLIEILGFHI